MGFNLDVLKNAKIIGEETPDWSQDGLSKQVFLIPLDSLYYNDDNGRTATWISSYLDVEGQIPLKDLSLNEYNNIVHDFVKKSNSVDTFKKTLNDIQIKGQIRPGVVLRDGRIVSGNRRFTVLRELYKLTGNDKFNYFKCFIEDKDLSKNEDRKYIKTIERLTQFGVDEKVDYDPIDRLVDIYNDLIGVNKIWEIGEYAKKLSLKVSDIEKMYIKAEIMADYLKYINKPNKFYIAKNYKLDGPLSELITTYKKTSTEEWNNIRILFYSFFHEKGDTTRVTRNLIQIYKNDYLKFSQLLEKQINEIEMNEETDYLAKPEININPEKQNVTIINEDFGKVVGVSEDTKKEIFDASNKAKLDEKRVEKVNKILNAFNLITNSLSDTFSIMTNNEKFLLKSSSNKLDEILKKLEDNIN